MVDSCVSVSINAAWSRLHVEQHIVLHQNPSWDACLTPRGCQRLIPRARHETVMFSCGIENESAAQPCSTALVSALTTGLFGCEECDAVVVCNCKPLPWAAGCIPLCNAGIPAAGVPVEKLEDIVSRMKDLAKNRGDASRRSRKERAAQRGTFRELCSIVQVSVLCRGWLCVACLQQAPHG